MLLRNASRKISLTLAPQDGCNSIRCELANKDAVCCRIKCNQTGRLWSWENVEALSKKLAPNRGKWRDYEKAQHWLLF